jgi:glycosyltransferase involved in cell wall biosynthesis
MKYPLVSVITPSLNQGEFIEETIKSVISQDYPNIEYIVIDGCSTDTTVDLLKKYSGRIKWISEPDRGQADAVNKGFKMAKGEILCWLNSDDTLNKGALKTVVKQFSENKNLVMVYSDAHIIDDKGKILRDYLTEEFIFNRLADTCFICQPTVFLSNEVMKEIGMLDTNLQTCMDYEYWIRIGRHFPASRISYMKGVYLANSRIYNENKTINLRKKVYHENMKTQRKYFGRVSKMWIYGYIKEIILGMRYKSPVK